MALLIFLVFNLLMINKTQHSMATNEELKTALDLKIKNNFSQNQNVIKYLLETKSNFLFRYLETSSDKNLPIESQDNTFLAKSYESNMGDAFKSTIKEVKAGVKDLAQKVPKNLGPKIEYSLTTSILHLEGDKGNIAIQSTIDWGFPEFSKNQQNSKSVTIQFDFDNAHDFRKNLALKYEEACQLFL